MLIWGQKANERITVDAHKRRWADSSEHTKQTQLSEVQGANVNDSDWRNESYQVGSSIQQVNLEPDTQHTRNSGLTYLSLSSATNKGITQSLIVRVRVRVGNSGTCSGWGQDRRSVSQDGRPTSTSDRSSAPPASSTPTGGPGPRDRAQQTLERRYKQCGRRVPEPQTL